MKSALNGVHGAPKFKGQPPRQKLINHTRIHCHKVVAIERCCYAIAGIILFSNIKYYFCINIHAAITGDKSVNTY